MPGVKPMPEPPDSRIIPLDRQAALTHQQVEQVRFGLGDTGPLAQAVLNANVPALAKQLATGAVSCLSSRRPADPVVGQMIFETDTQLSYFWGGSAWVNAGSPPVGAAGGDLSGFYPNPTVNYLVLSNPQIASYTLALTDSNKMVEINNAAANNLTVPLNATVPYPVGTQVTVLQTGAGQTTIVATGGVTINATPGLKLRTRWSSASLIKRGTDTWVALGDLVA